MRRRPGLPSLTTTPIASNFFYLHAPSYPITPTLHSITPTLRHSNPPTLHRCFKNRLPQRGFTYQPRVATLCRLASLPWVTRPLIPPNPERVASSSGRRFLIHI